MRFELYLDKSEAKRFIVSLPIPVNQMTEPLTLTRAKVAEEEEIQKTKKKSEQVEIVDEAYQKIKESEKAPLQITTHDNHLFLGRLQDTRLENATYDTDNTYFIFVNTGTSFKVVPVMHWYRFAQKVENETITLEEAELRIAKKKDDRWMMHKKKTDKKDGETEQDYSNKKEEEYHKKKKDEERDDKDIDFEDFFDDDDGEDYEILREEEKELDFAGEELKKIMSNYEKESSEDSEETKDDERKDDDVKRRKIDDKKKKIELDEVGIRECFVKEPMRVRELLVEIKKKYFLSDNGKILVKDFLKNECRNEIDPVTREKLLYLNKK